jgi:hypothetical protein
MAEKVRLSANFFCTLFHCGDQLSWVALPDSRGREQATAGFHERSAVRDYGFHGFFGSESFLQGIPAHYRYYPKPVPAINSRIAKKQSAYQAF